MTDSKIAAITDRIIENSRPTREAYLAKIEQGRSNGPARKRLSCGNLAHGFAACGTSDKQALAEGDAPNLGIVSSYNEMLSAHEPYASYPEQIKQAAHAAGMTAQFAGGVPAMCDGVTQGREGMDLSLFSRDVIAMSTAIALSHDMFDGAICLGICDKIVPGLTIGALSFGQLPVIFVPAGPMTPGLPNAEKVRVRQLFAEGKAGRKELLEAESASYHSAGTCTFYGTANSNQMLMEIMGLHLPGSSFVNPGTPLRDALTHAAVKQLAAITTRGNYTPMAEVVDEKSVVNGMVGLLATGGSTNHAIHLMAMARAAGVIIDWQDLSDLSDAVPLMCRIYPNGLADINRFQAVGGMGYLMRDLRAEGILHDDVKTVMGEGGLEPYTKEPFLEEGELVWRDAPQESLDDGVLRPAKRAFSTTGGMKLLTGNLGRCVIKVSAVKPEHRVVKAPAVVFQTQNALQEAFKADKLNKDFVAVVRFQGPKACGMPELHKLTPPLGVLQDRGFKVALVTDGRMSGASGKIPAAIHLTPEALDKGPIGLVRDGDIVEVDAETGVLKLHVSDEELKAREHAEFDLTASHEGMGRELFAPLRQTVGSAEEGATVFRW
ncbi:phosphogluconate dehydratase [Gilvimarinus agarilyticus]|uniref:phosphogluconate dehydratase n=1 Tax=unclassified Gilvimarinus TaxID=2642066 RepID=UPI001C088AAE|nr:MULTISPECIES: phosphogluconate dehydratase [unclassified Gilvimarinus]MBU2886453.1 phosphogluconate dehydratase [Gilvimarinus agarilyticus]MDO6571132.1 phosphogluconate dehydratase [Gilvimarinus sp. 2_MG-2023]MDO6745675.1 phosphogluconate dehydratase [Gilvimarinus sp. 1_MG-2023]